MDYKINPNDSHCPCCRMEKVDYREINHCLCYFCLVRSQLGTVKMFTLIVMSDLKHATVKEIAEAMNSHDINILNGKVRRHFSNDAVRRNLNDYSAKGYKLISKSKSSVRKHRNGRPPKLYSITKKGRKFLLKYKSRYLRGHSAVIPNHFSKKGYTPYERRLSTRHGKNHTKTTMIKKSDGFKFIFADCFRNYWNQVDPVFNNVRG